MFSALLDFEIRSCYTPEDGLELCEPPILASSIEVTGLHHHAAVLFSFEVHFSDVARTSKRLSVSRI